MGVYLQRVAGSLMLTSEVCCQLMAFTVSVA